jgi:hypothetical protein
MTRSLLITLRGREMERALPISKAQLRDAARILQEYDEWARKTAAAALSKANPPENGDT